MTNDGVLRHSRTKGRADKNGGWGDGSGIWRVRATQEFEGRWTKRWRAGTENRVAKAIGGFGELCDSGTGKFHESGIGKVGAAFVGELA